MHLIRDNKRLFYDNLDKLKWSGKKFNNKIVFKKYWLWNLLNPTFIAHQMIIIFINVHYLKKDVPREIRTGKKWSIGSVKTAKLH
jgi:hypothetical protein